MRTLPATLNPNQTLALQVQFKPTATGAVTGKLTVSSNSTTGATAAVAFERYGHGRSESKVDAERVEPELWQRDSEYSEDAVVDPDFDRDGGGNGELGCDLGYGLHDRGRNFTRDAEPETDVGAAGAVPTDRDRSRNREAYRQQ